MKVKSLGRNKTQIETDDKIILVSYQTPVAAWIRGRGYFRTATYHSVTTSRHIGEWLRDNGATRVTPINQDVLDKMLGGGEMTTSRTYTIWAINDQGASTDAGIDFSHPSGGRKYTSINAAVSAARLELGSGWKVNVVDNNGDTVKVFTIR